MLYYGIVHYYTTGILAGMWPCGIITFIRELFIAESKSQVYGHVHNFLQNSQETASCLSKLIFKSVIFMGTGFIL